MRGLMAAVIGMGILIVAGVTVLVVVMVQRMSSPPAPIASAVVTSTAPAPTDILIDEPIGTRIAFLSLAGDRLAVQLAGGGPDRVVLVDTRTGRIIARTGLAR